MIFYSNTRPLKKLFKHWQSGLTRNYGCDNVNYLYLGKGIVNNHVRTGCQVIVIPRLVKKSVQQANAYHSSVLSVGLIFFLRRFFNISFSCTFNFDNRRRDDVIFVQWQCRYLCQSQSFSSPQSLHKEGL